MGVFIDDDVHIPILLYADDVVIIAPSHQKCQAMLDILTKWCRRWGMRVNHAKSQVGHIRNHQQTRCDRDLYLDMREIQYVSDYKYLGCWINEFFESLTSVAGRSLENS